MSDAFCNKCKKETETEQSKQGDMLLIICKDCGEIKGVIADLSDKKPCPFKYNEWNLVFCRLMYTTPIAPHLNECVGQDICPIYNGGMK